MFSIELFQANLNTKFLGHGLKYLPQTNSTNENTWEYFQNGSPEGTLFITDDQQKGKGRRQNNWVSTKEKSLTFSFILQPEMQLEKLGLLPLLTGVSIVEAIKSAASIQTGLKWPNDIMLNEKKMGGILVESKSGQNGLGVVVGVGLNINESEQDIPDSLSKQATSLAIYSNSSYSRELILSAILNEFEQLYQNQMDDIIPLWQEYCIHRDTSVTFHSENHRSRGIFQGINSLGHAEINMNGKTESFSAGMVTL